MNKSYYNTDFYGEMAIKSFQGYRDNLRDFVSNKDEYLLTYLQIDSVHILLDSLSNTYNISLEQNRLVEKLIFSENFQDIVNDWLLVNKAQVATLKAPEFK